MAQVRETLAGRYELLDVLGRGGMGVVYSATDQVLGRTVAIKMLPLDRASDPTFVARFEREALAAAALNHPNIVAIYDSGRDADTRFIVMERAAGRSLAEVLADQGCLAPEEAVAIATQIADALGAAHRAGVIHRDIKPANVMVDEDLRVKVLDFGIARAAADATLTQADVILGSAPYLAPEVSSGLPADARSDIYALGCVVYAMLTGDPPFSGELPAAVMQQHIVADPRPPRELNAAIPAPLEALILRMLAKDPDARPQTAAALALALPASLREEAGTVPMAPMPGAVTAATLAQTAPTQVHRAPTAQRTSTRVQPPIPVLTGTRSSRSKIALLTGLALVILLVALSGIGGGSAKRTAAKHRVRHVAAHSARAQASAGRVRTSVATAATHRAPLLSVPAAFSALTALVNRDAQSGLIDQHAVGALLGPLRGALNAAESGNPAGALGPVGGLPAQVAQLASSGDIHPSALTPLETAIGQLQLALERAAPQSGQTGPPGGPPGHDDGKPKPPKAHGPKGPKGKGPDGGGD